jgi:Skp family chaperone for outer membrane proteins
MMNGKTIVTALVVGVIALLATRQYSRAESQPAAAPCKIGIVSVRGALNGSRKYTQYRALALKRQSQARAQLEALTKDSESAEAELKTLKPGTPDYMQQLQTALEKRAKLDSQQEYLKQQRALEDKKSMEELYQEVLRVVKDLAKEKGLALVLEKTEPEFPIAAEEWVLTFSSHKVLYDGGCVNLTNEVIARIDAGESVPAPADR